MLLVFCLVSLSLRCSADFRKETNFIEYAQVSSTVSTSLLNIQPERPFRSILRCSLECLITEACGAFIYHSTTGQCLFYTVLFRQTVPGMTPPKMWYYYPAKRGYQWCPVERGFQLLAANGPCVLFSDDTKSWTEANSTTCPSYGTNGRLVVLDTQEKADLLTAAGKSINHIFSGGLHIGLHLTSWVDGTPLTYNNLAFGMLPANRPCATIARGTKAKQWCPVERGFQLFGLQGPCVLFSHDVKSWTEANSTTCPSYGPNGRLVVLDTQEKADLFTTAGKSINHIFNGALHIGLHLTTWVNGAPLTYNNIEQSRPPQGSEPCGQMGRSINWQWAGTACERISHYVCEIYMG